MHDVRVAGSDEEIRCYARSRGPPKGFSGCHWGYTIDLPESGLHLLPITWARRRDEPGDWVHT